MTNKTNLSDNETWRYQFDLRPLSGTSAGQINISQVIGGMIWTGPGEGDVVTSTMKMYQGDTLVDTKQVNATFDHIKGGLYIDRGQENRRLFGELHENQRLHNHLRLSYQRRWDNF